MDRPASSNARSSLTRNTRASAKALKTGSGPNPERDNVVNAHSNGGPTLPWAVSCIIQATSSLTRAALGIAHGSSRGEGQEEQAPPEGTPVDYSKPASANEYGLPLPTMK